MNEIAHKKFLIVILVPLMILALLWLLWPRIRISPGDAKAILKYHTEIEDISVTLTEEEQNEISRILHGKRLDISKTVPSCGFAEKVSITIGKDVFYIASDTCPIIYYPNRDKYFGIREKEINEIHQIFEKYGGRFPCLYF